MPTAALVGASGLLGGAIARELLARGLDVVAIGRDEPRIRARLGPVIRGQPAQEVAADAWSRLEVRTIPTLEHDRLVSAIAGCDVVISAVGGGPGMAEVMLASAASSGADLVDVAPEQHHVQSLFEQRHVAMDAGIRVVPGTGLQYLVGDCLAHLAAMATGAAREIHIAYTLPDHGSLLADATDGRRRSAATELLAPSLALERGVLRPELLGEQRRLAWFPRPVGPAHAAAIPGGEVITVPLHVPGVMTVRTYVALTGWRSELLQFTGNLARFSRPRTMLVRRLGRPRSGMDRARQRRVRWGCVAEANGELGVARAWAHGHDPVGLTAVAAASVTCAVLEDDGVEVGVVPPARLGRPEELLDDLASRTDLRWSIRRPESGG